MAGPQTEPHFNVGGSVVPWSAVANDSEAPFVRWYIDALTSAAFNELDRHILQVRMHDTELISLILFTCAF